MNRIREQRKKLKMTQTDLAKKMNVRQSTVSMWETYASMPRSDMLPLLAKTLKCTIDDLYLDGR